MSNFNIAYYPGCSGSGSSVEYEASTRLVCSKLGINLEEIEGWSCCGSSPAHTVNHVLSAALSGRNLALASKQGHDTVATPCPSCLMNLRTAAHKAEHEEFRAKVNALLDENEQLGAHVEPKSVLQVIGEDFGVDRVKQMVVAPLKGLKVACYYGCIMNRPPELMKFDDHENPMVMDNLMKAAGCTPVPFPLKVECCGASSGIPKKEIVMRLSGRILSAAAEAGADAIVVACPLCQMNLDLRQGQVNRANGLSKKLPVFYFTQLLGLALGIEKPRLRFDKLVVDPNPCLAMAEENQG